MVLRLQRAAAYLIILGVAIYLWFVAEQFQYEHVPGRIGPDAWPKIVLILMMATCLWQVARVVIFGAQPVPPDEMDEETPIVPPDAGNFVYLAWIGVAVAVVYAYLMPLIGFFVSTVIFIAASAFIAGRYRKPVPLIVSSVVAPVILMFVFMRIVYISLPLGRGAFKELSLMLLKILGVH
ncbi:MAG: tripartite tricarboxylate transporter TctB family protein [Vulcanimicrobiaceae bacterium]